MAGHQLLAHYYAVSDPASSDAVCALGAEVGSGEENLKIPTINILTLVV